MARIYFVTAAGLNYLGGDATRKLARKA